MPSVTRSRRPRNQAKKDAVEQAMLDALQRLGDRGISFTEASVEQLAREAGIARSTFYVHFRDKSDLVRRLAGRLTEEMIQASRIWSAVAPEATRDDLHRTVQAAISVFLKRRALFNAFVQTAIYDPDVQEIYEDMMDRMISEVRKAHLRVREAGRFHPDACPEIAEIHVYSMEHCCHRMAQEEDPEVIERLAQGLTHMLWNSLYAPSAR